MPSLQFKEIATVNVQHCPLCGMPQEGVLNGTITKNGEYTVQKDKWYSFCNCHNIFFTDWSNMKQEVYDASYQEKYAGPAINKRIVDHDKDILSKIPTKNGLFIEVGVVTDRILDDANALGFDTIAVDINKDTKSKHRLIVANFDDSSDLVPNCDVIWASHVFEHFKDPIQAAKNMFGKLNAGGSLYVSMPDTWFIPWDNAHCWAHWHCQEHHILWDMDSFIDMLIDVGFKLEYSKRRSYGADFHVIMRKP